MTILQRGDGELGYLLHRQVQILPVMTIVSVAVVLYLVCLVVRTAWIVHHHQEGTVQVLAYGFLIETLRSILLRLANLLAILVAESIGKFLYRFAESKTQHVINLTEHLVLASLDSCRLLTLSHHLAEFQTILAELAAYETAHLGSIVA